MEAPESSVSKINRHNFRDDIIAIQDNVSVPTMLETICLATGLRFAAVARVTEQRWITCSTIDTLDFGLAPGNELVVESTLCLGARHCVTEIIINDAERDEVYRYHRTPKHGFRSYL